MSGTAKYAQTNFNVDDSTTYKTKIDSNFIALTVAAAFQPYADPSPAMHILLAAGALLVNGSPVSQALQTTATITAPISHARIDRVVIDQNTAVQSIVAGVENVSPVAPAVPQGKIPCAQILLQTSSTSIDNTMITDERVVMAIPQNNVALSARQCVQNGSKDANGLANWLVAGTGLTVNYSATTTPVELAFADGFGPNGEVDHIVQVSADATNQFGTLAANNTSLLFADFVDGTHFTGGNTLAPQQMGSIYNRAAQSVLQFGGAAGSTTFLDDFGSPWTAQSGAKVQTNQIKFGTGALGGGGAGNALNGTTDFIKSTGFSSLGNGSWAMRCWAQPTALPGSGAVAMIFSYSTVTFPSVQLFIFNNSGTIKFTYNLSSNGSSTDIASNVQGTTTPVINTWFFLELTFDALAGVYRLYVNGTQEASTTSSTRVIAGSILSLAASTSPSNANFFQGYIDKFEYLPYCQRPNGTSYSSPAASPSIIAAGYASDFYSTADAKIYKVSAASGSSGSNPSLTSAARLYVGEGDTNGSALTSVRSYAYQRRLVTPEQVGAASTPLAFNHNLGVPPNLQKITARLRNILLGSVGNFKVGDVIEVANNNTAATRGFTVLSRNSNTAIFDCGALFDLTGGTGNTFAGVMISLDVEATL